MPYFVNATLANWRCECHGLYGIYSPILPVPSIPFAPSHVDASDDYDHLVPIASSLSSMNFKSIRERFLVDLCPLQLKSSPLVLNL